MEQLQTTSLLTVVGRNHDLLQGMARPAYYFEFEMLFYKVFA